MTCLKLTIISVLCYLSNCDVTFNFTETRDPTGDSMNCVCNCTSVGDNQFIPSVEKAICPVPDCQKGFVKLSTGCYHFSEIATSFSSAHQYCKGIGSKLISLETMEEIQAIKQHIYKLFAFDDVAFWTSGNDIRSNGQLTWSENSPDVMKVNVDDFCEGEPAFGTDTHCIQIWNWEGKNCWWKWFCNLVSYDGGKIPFRPICEG